MKIQFQHSGKSLTETEIQQFEQRHGLTLPEDYQKFLLQFNGGMPFPQACETASDFRIGVLQLYSLNDDFPYDLDHACLSTDWEEAYDNGYLQVGHDPGGSGILMSTRGSDRGAIYFFEREEAIRSPQGSIRIADSFSQFIGSLAPFE
jgi:hypothetical protein